MPDPTNPTPDTPAHLAIQDAERALVPVRAKLRDAEEAIARMKNRAVALLATDDVVRDLLADYAESEAELRKHYADTRVVDGGVFGPHGTPELQDAYYAISRREYLVKTKLLAIGEVMLERRRELAAAHEEAAQ